MLLHQNHGHTVSIRLYLSILTESLIIVHGVIVLRISTPFSENWFNKIGLNPEVIVTLSSKAEEEIHLYVANSKIQYVEVYKAT